MLTASKEHWGISARFHYKSKGLLQSFSWSFLDLKHLWMFSLPALIPMLLKSSRLLANQLSKNSRTSRLTLSPFVLHTLDIVPSHLLFISLMTKRSLWHPSVFIKFHLYWRGDRTSHWYELSIPLQKVFVKRRNVLSLASFLWKSLWQWKE